MNQTTMEMTLDDLMFCLASTSDKASAKLPPTENAFLQRILRCKIQLQIWLNSHDPKSSLWSPVNNGWSVEGGSLKPVMMTLSPAPEELRNMTHLFCKEQNCTLTRKCPCIAAIMPCISVCACFEGSCQNTSGKITENERQDE